MSQNTLTFCNDGFTIILVEKALQRGEGFV